VNARPTMPYTQEERIAILNASSELHGDSGDRGKANLHRLRALVLVLRYSGMRIGDAVRCAVERLYGNQLLLYTQKTRVPVYCPLPEFVVKTLEELTPVSERYFSGRARRNCKLRQAIGRPSSRGGSKRQSFRMVTLTDSAIHLRSNYSGQVFRLNEFQSSWATLAFGLPSGTTAPGCAHVKSKPKLMCDGLGDKIPWRSSKRRVRHNYTERAPSLTS